MWIALLRKAWPYLAIVLVVVGVLRIAERHGYHSRDTSFAQVELRAKNSHTAFLMEQANFRTSVGNWRRATAEAQAVDKRHAEQSQAAQTVANKESDRVYQDQLASLRARYDRLRGTAGAPGSTAGGSSGAASVRGAGTSAGGPDGTPARDRLLDFAQSADENTLQLIRLQAAVRARDDAFNAMEKAQAVAAVPGR